jgi:predicted enzyme related to lactoylglutathione lyase
MAEEPQNVLIAKGLDPEFKEQLTHVLKMYKDVFAWSYEDMKGLNPEFYHVKTCDAEAVG